MSIIKAIKNAYDKKRQCNWERIYWAIDLHGVCIESDYQNGFGVYDWINPQAVEALRAISDRPESHIILWSSVNPSEQEELIWFFGTFGITVDNFNCNPHEEGNNVTCFDEKFYFSILLDDKAGFDPEEDWQLIIDYMKDME